MKTVINILTGGLFLMLLSCGTTHQTPPTVNNTPDTKGTIREVADMDDSGRSNRTDRSSSTADDRTTNQSSQYSGNTDYANDQQRMDASSSRNMDESESQTYWNEMKNKNMESMYSYLNMSEDQIKKYQRGYVEYMGEMQDKHMRQTISQKDLMKQRDGILKDILKSGQYDKYQQWMRENPDYGM